MKKLTDLETAQFEQVNRLRDKLRLLGCNHFLDTSGPEHEWLERSFEDWRARDIYLFLMPPQATEFSYIRYHSFGNVIFYNEDSYNREIIDRGYFIFANNYSGDYFVMDTTSTTGMDVSLIDCAYFGGYGLVDDCMVIKGIDFEDFLKLVAEHPDGYMKDNYYVW